MQIQLNKVDNGWLVMSPPQDSRISARTPQEQPQPVVHFCADYDDVCNYIKQFFPIS